MVDVYTLAFLGIGSKDVHPSKINSKKTDKRRRPLYCKTLIMTVVVLSNGGIGSLIGSS